ncbi:hypothetical protein [Azospirillum thermophilum]|uniref:Uncharacterized protein n=1 Tax=Azospirillum thermophilum TaxID=2202148 RepID=A0A2S2CLZ7_9PROT|nr:hypothetical protein [Azospirillum thermophilum]AWK85535.1 hypothetical protein DEW08_04565 [Azospirillum thermophilum]
MDQLKAALQRLNKAVDRLEHAASAREERVSRREQELTQALETARADHARAQATADTVSQRLELAIHRLEQVLES